MKRGGGPKRDPEKTRAWQQRSREASPLSRSAPLEPGEGLRRAGGRTGLSRGSRRPRPPEGPLSPADWKRAVWQLAAGRCTVTGLPLSRVDDEFGDHAHHCIPKQLLRRRGLHHLVWDPRNGIALKRAVHEAHEYTPNARVPYEALPQRVRDFATELGPWAEDALLRYHPAAGTSGASE